MRCTNIIFACAVFILMEGSTLMSATVAYWLTTWTGGEREVEWSGAEWSLSEVEWSGVEWSGVDWSGVECSGVQWTCNTAKPFAEDELGTMPKYAFLGFILISRVGLYGFCIGYVQILQTGVDENVRGAVNAIDKSFTKIAMLVIAAG